MMPDSGFWDMRVAWWGEPVGMRAEAWICRMRGMRVGAEGAGERRAPWGMPGEGPVMIRGACAEAAREKANASEQNETYKSNR